MVVVLVATNLFMLWYFTRPKPKKEKLTGTERMANYVQKELKFTDEQTARYVQLRHRRDSQLVPVQANLRQAKMDLIALLKNPDTPDSVIDAATRRVGEMQAPVERAYYNHFRRISNICTPQQKPLFFDLLSRSIRRNTGDTSVANPPR